MVDFKKVVKGTGINDWWSNGDNQNASCRGRSGFIAFTNGGDFDQTLQTCLVAGGYCDIISGNHVNGLFTGKTVTVGSMSHITIAVGEDDGVLAIHANSRL